MKEFVKSTLFPSPKRSLDSSAKVRGFCCGMAMMATLLLATQPANAASVFMTGNDTNGPVTSFNGARKWSDGAAPTSGNDYYSSTWYIRTPASVSATSYTFGGDSLTLQAFAAANARSMLFKGFNGDELIINNFTNAAGSRIDQGSGAAGASISGNRWTIAGDSTLAADQGGPWTINSPLAGSANFTNLGAGTITYNGDNSAFNGRFVLGGTTAKVILNSLSALPGNPAASTPDQFILGATSLLQDNVGVTYNNSNGGITLAGASTISAATAGANTTIAVPITGAFALTKTGNGILTLSGSNTFTGGLTFNAGQLNINSTNAIGTNTFNINVAGGVIDNTSGGAISNANNNPVTISQSFTFNGSSDLDLGTGNVNNGSLAKTATVSAGTLTFGGAFTGAGQFTKDGSGTLRMRGASTGLGGGLIINAGTLALTGGALITNVPNITIASGAILDVSGLSSPFTLGASRSQSISNSIGALNGSVVTTGAASLSPDAPNVPGTLTFNNNLDMSAGGAVYLDLSTTYNSANDQIVVGGNLSLSSSDTIHINAYSGGPLDETADYILFAGSGTTTMTTTPALVWDGTPPSNSGNFSIKKSGNNVVLRYAAGTPPTVTATSFPDPATRNQTVTITANVTKGSAAIASVSVNLTALGGSSTSALVLDSASSSDPNFVYTNTFTVGSSTAVGSQNLAVTVTDTSSPTPLTGIYNLPITVAASSLTWDGGGANNNWSSGANWLGDFAPGLVGDSLTFAGTLRLAPDMNAGYNVAGLTFDGTAGAFTLGSSTGSTLTNSAGIVNNSANPQTVNVPMVLTAAQTFNAAVGNLTVNSNVILGATLTVDGPTDTSLAGAISGNGGLTKTGNGKLTLAASNSIGGNAWFKGGTTVIESGASLTTPTWCSVGLSGSDIATLTLKGTGAFTNSNDFNIGDVDAAVGTLNIQDNSVLSVASLFVASANNAGSTVIGTVNQSGGAVIQTSSAIGTFVIGGRNAASTGGVGIYNLSGGTLTATAPVRMSGYGSSTFNQTGGRFTSASALGGINLQRFAGPGGTYNLDGGVAEFNNIDATVASTDPTFHSVFNFNGGTLKPTSSTPTGGPFIPAHLSAANVRNGGAIIDTAGFSVSIAQPLQHSSIGGDNATDGGLTKLGIGTLTLAGTNTYTGATTVSNGTLFVSGLLGTGTVTVKGGALAGTGTIGGAVTVNSGASLAPQNSGAGSLTISGNITLNAGSTNTFAVNGSTPANDTVTAGGAVNYGGVLNIVTNGSFYSGQTFTLFSGAGAVNNGNFASIAGSPGSGLAFSFTNGVLSVVTAAPSGPATLTNSISGNVLSLSWPGGQGWTLQSQTNTLATGLGTNWVDVPGSTATNAATITINPTNPTVFYRLRK
jgi:fibronectin-binding autotransporter adhesin